MWYTSIVFAMVLISAIYYPAVSQNSINGIVLDDQGKPLSGALVALVGTSLSYTTLADGKFSLSSSKIRSTSLSNLHSRNQIKLSNSSIELNNPMAQNVSLTLFDLRGKTINKLYDGFLSSGQYRFTMPVYAKNQTIILQTQIGSIQESFKVTGSFFSKKITANNVGRIIESKTNAVIDNQVLVTHSRYDEKNVTVKSQDDSLIIQLYRKLSLYTLNQIRVGDTLSIDSKSVRVSLDSIHDERCGCDVFCGIAGNASLYFTVSINGVSHPVTLRINDKQQTTIEGYTVYLRDINPCRQMDPDDYVVDIAIYLTDKSKILFLELFSSKDGTVVSGNCNLMKIDFPSYSYSSLLGILENNGYLAINDSTKVILGNGFSLQGAAGGGISSGLTVINSIPYTHSSGLTINEIQEDGTVKLLRAGEALSLAPGESWSVDTTYLETTPECQRNITARSRISNFRLLMPYKIKQAY